VRKGERRGEGSSAREIRTHDVVMTGEILKDRHLAPSVLLVSLDRLL
jgi:hypothetical protein